jgi:hypothetical protein
MDTEVINTINGNVYGVYNDSNNATIDSGTTVYFSIRIKKRSMNSVNSVNNIINGIVYGVYNTFKENLNLERTTITFSSGVNEIKGYLILIRDDTSSYTGVNNKVIFNDGTNTILGNVKASDFKDKAVSIQISGGTNSFGTFNSDKIFKAYILIFSKNDSGYINTFYSDVIINSSWVAEGGTNIFYGEVDYVAEKDLSLSYGSFTFKNEFSLPNADLYVDNGLYLIFDASDDNLHKLSTKSLTLGGIDSHAFLKLMGQDYMIELPKSSSGMSVLKDSTIEIFDHKLIVQGKLLLEKESIL